MSDLLPRPVIYEVSLRVAPAVAAEYDDWLRGHVADMLDLPGFLGAEILTPEATADGAMQRVVQYRLRDRSALDAYLRDHAPRMRSQGTARFGDQVTAERRILEPASGGEPLPQPQGCPNCGSLLVTEFCAQCGQENKDYHISFFRLIGDLLGDTFNFDTRLTNSIKPLLFKPGLLTREYMDGRRARYVPPLRTYIFISIVFFALAAISNEPESHVIHDAAEIAQQEDAAPTVDPPNDGLNIGTSVDEEALKEMEDSPSWINSMVEEFVKGSKLIGKNPQLFVQQLLSNLSLAMFALLPVYALFLKLLYAFSRRYYMEHLIFALHIHAFTLLIFTIMMVWSQWIAPRLPFDTHGLLITAIIFYIMLYPWFALRRNYNQGWWLTTVKYLTLGTLHFFALSVVLGSVAVYTTMSLD